jgi:outer membrane protein OmpA-like peptidoglycan-associated protein
VKGVDDLKKFVFILAVFRASVGPLHAQTAERLDAILDTAEVTCAMAAFVVLPAAGLIDGNSAPDAAFAEARARDYLPRNAAADTPIRLGELSFLIMQAFGMKSGFMYALFPGPRYAYRELVYRKLIQGRNDPALAVSGERLLRIIGRVLDYRGDGEPALTAAPAEVPAEVPAPPIVEERERVAELIHTELEEKRVSDTDVRVGSAGITISLNNIQFLPDSTELTEAEKNKLTRIASILNEFPDRRILVGGHTAMAGSAEGRTRISAGRAQAVAEYLISLGCRERSEITVRGYGAEQPLGDPATAEGQALNRRVEIILLDAGEDGNE